MQVLASQLPFLANRNAEQAVPPLFWPVNCIKIGRHVALLSGPSVYVYSVATHVKTLQLVTSLQTSRQQDVFALLVPKLSTSCSKLVDNL